LAAVGAAAALLVARRRHLRRVGVHHALMQYKTKNKTHVTGCMFMDLLVNRYE
jgi:hypothetical protein